MQGYAPVNPKRWGCVLITGILLFSSGCAGGGWRGFLGSVFVPPEQERMLGTQFAQEVPNQYKIHPDARVQEYISQVGNRVARFALEDRPDVTYQFTAIDSRNEVNAFAVPGGYIYMFSGLMLLADNEAEIAAVLAHECAHVVHRHSANRIGTAIGFDLLTSMALGEEPGILAQVAANLGTTATLLHYSREDEREADRSGLRYLIAAGYDPNAMVTFFEKLAGDKEAPAWTAFLSSHPLTSERIDNMRMEIVRYGNPGGVLNREAHQQMRPLF